MTTSLDTELDALFRLPPAEMVAARNALADRLKKAGDKAASASIKALKRPTPGAFGLNQVHFQHAALLDKARAETARLRELHQRDGASAQELSAAMAAQRNAMYAVIEAAVRCCQAAGLPGDGALQRKLYTTLQASLAGQGDEAPGRMTHDIEPSGFEAIAAMGMLGTASVPAPMPAPEPAAAQPEVAQPSVRERAAALVAERMRQVRETSDELARRRAAADRARLEFERTQRELRAAEEALLVLRATANEREAESSRLRAAVEAAEEAHRQAERALSDAQAAMPR